MHVDPESSLEGRPSFGRAWLALWIVWLVGPGSTAVWQLLRVAFPTIDDSALGAGLAALVLLLQWIGLLCWILVGLSLGRRVRLQYWLLGAYYAWWLLLCCSSRFGFLSALDSDSKSPVISAWLLIVGMLMPLSLAMRALSSSGQPRR